MEKFKTNGENGERLELVTFVKNVTINESGLHGLVVYESPLPIQQVDETTKWVKAAFVVKFAFVSSNGSIFFIPLTGGSCAEIVATKMNTGIFKNDAILKQLISSDAIEEFLKQNPHTFRSGRWAGLDIPGISKAGLAGADLLQSRDPKRYDEHGHKSFVIITLKENGQTVGLSQFGGVAFYSDVDEEGKLQFVKNKILPLL
jgi:hypothetical protein